MASFSLEITPSPIVVQVNVTVSTGNPAGTDTGILGLIQAQLATILQNQGGFVAILSGVAAAVQACQTVEGSVETLLQQVTAELAALPQTAELEDLTRQIRHNARNLANAVVANTPYDPAGRTVRHD